MALSPLVFVSHNPPLWESGAWLTGLQNQIQGPPSSQTLSSQDPNSTFAKTTFSSILLAIQISRQKGSALTFFGWSDKANAKVKVLRFWWEFPNWIPRTVSFPRPRSCYVRLVVDWPMALPIIDRQFDILYIVLVLALDWPIALLINELRYHLCLGNWDSKASWG